MASSVQMLSLYIFFSSVLLLQMTGLECFCLLLGFLSALLILTGFLQIPFGFKVDQSSMFQL